MPESKDPKRAAYSKATSRLREQYKDEFQALVAEEMGKAGVTDWKPRPTAEEKARKQVADLLAQYPEIATSLTGGQVQ